MTFSGHLAVGALVLTATTNPLLVVPLCFLLHLALDAVPHVEWCHPAKAGGVALSLMVADAVATASLLFLMLAAFPHVPLAVILAVVFSLLPDLTDSWARKYLHPFRRLHLATHTLPCWPDREIDWNRTLTGKTPTVLKILIQLFLVGGTGLILFGRIS